MTERRLQKNSAAEEIPGTPRIRDVRIVFGSEVTGLCGRGSSRVPFKLKDNYDGVGDFDLKKMEENAAKLEKDLIMKELETLDFLEALGSTKKIVKDLKLELQQQQPVKCMESPEHLRSQIKEMNHGERCHRSLLKSPDMVFTELKQASMNLGKTMDDLSMIRSYVESLNMKTVEHKDFIGVASLAEELNSLRSKHDDEERFITKNVYVNPQCEQVKMVVETNDNKQSSACLKTAKMRLVAARKMEEAARAAEALAIAEMTILCTNKDEFCFPELPPRSPLTLKEQMQEDISIEIMRKLEEANEEVKQSQRALEAALNRVEIANVKQLEAEDAVRQWNIESWKDQKAIRAKRSMKGDDNIPRRSFLSHVNQHEPLDDLPKPMLKRNVSVGSGLNRKQPALNIDEKQSRRKFRFIHHTVPEQTE
ncbi:LOW QUALITY PROTEIN: WEB family protein At3g56270 [Raphanus sativus]|uniref:LOW QUALITY PROTEIN: WEB family protein At3g56270 n=1 Tax=Raphanus sativus TaxID=3726 RepID=A0A6J0LPE5_RAPSA|nr:LOW QUALITY PROTEIN: WEB family protein At3g56270 [Raphanus sativus]